MKNHLPNLISTLRIICSCVLPLTTGSLPWFLVMFFIIAISDALDGWLARKLDATSEFGAKLDSFGDLCYFIAMIIILYRYFIPTQRPVILWTLAIVGAIKIGNLVFTKLKFGFWGSIHTFLSKVTGFLLFCILPVCYLLKQVPNALIYGIGALAFIASAEETIILSTNSNYDINQMSVFSKRSMPAES